MSKKLLEATQDFVNEVIARKYLQGNEKSFSDLANRFDKAIDNKYSWKKDFIKYLSDKKILPAGSVLASFGTAQKSSFSNCYVVPIECDSIECIFDALKKASRTFSWRGGVGFDITILRPNGSPVNNSAKTSSGAVSFMPLISTVVNTIGQNGRRGASIITMDIRHPDIIRFIKSKSNPEEVFEKDELNNYLPTVHYANISVKITDTFMKAVEQDSDWNLVFPDIDADREMYEDNWNGIYEDWEAIGGKLKAYDTIKARDLFNLISENAWKRAEPGVLFWDKSRNNSPQNALKETSILTVNPCVTGDTLVAVADGRGDVPIKTLAEDGKDIPVYSVDTDGNLVIKMMRHPRITGYNEDIYEVKLDDGSSIKVTGNHEFRMKDGSYKEAKDLKSGDSLDVWSKVIDNKGYCRIYKKSNYMFEHRFIYEQLMKDTIGENEVIHHIDHNKLNNNVSNLKKLWVSTHNSIHISGDKNPMRRFPEKSNFNNPEWQQEMREKYHIGAKRSEETKRKIGETTKARMNNPEYKEKWLYKIRQANSTEEKRKHISSARLQYFLNKAKEQTDLPVLIHNSSVSVKKKCEVCGKEFIVPFYKREQAYCSYKCSAIGSAKKTSCALSFRNQQRRDKHKEKVWDLFSKYTTENKVIPIYKAFKSILNKNGINDLRTAGFSGYTDFLKYVGSKFDIEVNSYIKTEPKRSAIANKLIEKGLTYNHKVVSVTKIGQENVYNGTVDDTHNFCISLGKYKNKNGKEKTCYVTSLNCGEQQLFPYGACSLFHLVLHKFVVNPYTDKAEFDFSEFQKAIWTLMDFADFLSDVNVHPLTEQQEIEKLARKIGIGITGLADSFAMLGIKYDSQQALDFADKLFSFFAKTTFETTIDMAEQKGMCPLLQRDGNFKKYLKFPGLKPFIGLLDEEYKKKLYDYGVRNISWSTIAPTGTVSIVADNCTSGIEPLFSIKYIRNSRLFNKSVELVHAPLLQYLIENQPDDLKLSDEKLLSKYNYRQANEIDFTFRIKLQGIIQKYITDSISSTINLPADTSKEAIQKLYMEAYKNNLKGITVYRDGCMTGVLNTAKEENNKSDKLEIPYERTSKTYTMLWKKNKVYITIPEVNGNPIEVFVNLPPEASYDTNRKKNLPLKLERESTWNAITRLISLNLRRNTPVEEVVKHLNKASNTIGDLPNIVSRALSKSYTKSQVKGEICPVCGNTTLVKEGGCNICKSCGYSKCD